MKENLPLTGPFVLKGDTDKIKNIIIMLHGYGSNGNDLIQIAKIWKEKFPYSYFVAPNAPYKFHHIPSGYMWFDINKDDVVDTDIADKQKKSIESDFLKSCDILEDYIYQLSKKFKLGLNKFFLLGFSQGSMMSLEVGTRLDQKLAGIISLSGRIYTENFNNKNRNKSPILIIHGAKDEIIKTHRFYETCEILKKFEFNVESYLIRDLDHSISSEVMSISENFILLNQ